MQYVFFHDNNSQYDVAILFNYFKKNDENNEYLQFNFDEALDKAKDFLLKLYDATIKNSNENFYFIFLVKEDKMFQENGYGTTLINRDNNSSFLNNLNKIKNINNVQLNIIFLGDYQEGYVENSKNIFYGNINTLTNISHKKFAVLIEKTNKVEYCFLEKQIIPLTNNLDTTIGSNISKFIEIEDFDKTISDEVKKISETVKDNFKKELSSYCKEAWQYEKIYSLAGEYKDDNLGFVKFLSEVLIKFNNKYKSNLEFITKLEKLKSISKFIYNYDFDKKIKKNFNINNIMKNISDQLFNELSGISLNFLDKNKLINFYFYLDKVCNSSGENTFKNIFLNVFGLYDNQEKLFEIYFHANSNMISNQEKLDLIIKIKENIEKAHGNKIKSKAGSEIKSEDKSEIIIAVNDNKLTLPFVQYLSLHNKENNCIVNFNNIGNTLNHSEFLVNKAFGWSGNTVQTVTKMSTDSSIVQEISDQVFELDYAKSAWHQSVYGPGAYLYDLVRVIFTYIEPKDGMSIHDRRSDIFDIPIDEKNTNKRRLPITTVNAILARHITAIDQNALKEKHFAQLKSGPSYMKVNKIYENEAIKTLSKEQPNIFKPMLDDVYNTFYIISDVLGFSLNNFLQDINKRSNKFALLDKKLSPKENSLLTADSYPKTMNYLQVSEKEISTEDFGKKFNLQYQEIGALFFEYDSNIYKKDTMSSFSYYLLDQLSRRVGYYINYVDDVSCPWFSLHLDRVNGKESVIMSDNQDINNKRLHRLGLFTFLSKKLNWSFVDLELMLAVLGIERLLSRKDLDNLYQIKNICDNLKCNLSDVALFLLPEKFINQNEVLSDSVYQAVSFVKNDKVDSSNKEIYRAFMIISACVGMSQQDVLILMKNINNSDSQMNTSVFLSMFLCFSSLCRIFNSDLNNILALCELSNIKLYEIINDRFNNQSSETKKIIEALNEIHETNRVIKNHKIDCKFLLNASRLLSKIFGSSYEFDNFINNKYIDIFDKIEKNEIKSLKEIFINFLKIEDTHVQEIIADKFCMKMGGLNLNGYDLLLKSKNDLNENAKENKNPILIKMENGSYKLWGDKDGKGKWEETELINFEFPVDWQSKESIYVSDADSSIWNTLKQGHTHFNDVTFIREYFLKISLFILLADYLNVPIEKSKKLDIFYDRYDKILFCDTNSERNKIIHFVESYNQYQKAIFYFQLEGENNFHGLMKGLSWSNDFSKAVQEYYSTFFSDLVGNDKEINKIIFYYKVDQWKEKLKYHSSLLAMILKHQLTHKNENDVNNVTENPSEEKLLSSFNELSLGEVKKNTPGLHQKIIAKRGELVRDVFVQSILSEKKEIKSIAELSRYLLIDLEVFGLSEEQESALLVDNKVIKDGISSSAIVQGYLSLQYYLQGIRMGTESVKENKIPNAYWPWLTNYRVWEANRKLLLHPENYLDPELRYHISPQFSNFSQELKQSHLNDKSVDAACRRYITAINELMSLKYVTSIQVPLNQLQSANGEKKRVFILAKNEIGQTNYFFRSVIVTIEENKITNYEDWTCWSSVQVPIQNPVENKFQLSMNKKNQIFLTWEEKDQNKLFDSGKEIYNYEKTKNEYPYYKRKEGDNQATTSINEEPTVKYQSALGIDNIWGVKTKISDANKEQEKLPEELEKNIKEIFTKTLPNQFLQSLYDYNSDILTAYKGLKFEDSINFDSGVGIYIWELAFFMPLLIANSFRAQSAYQQAMDWYHIVFNPYQPGEDLSLFQFKGLNISANSNLCSMLNDNAQKEVYHDGKFDAHAIAKYRPLAYKKYTVMAYLENLLEWGDSLFQLNTFENIEKAKWCYHMVSTLIVKPKTLHTASHVNIKTRYLGDLLLANTKPNSEIKLNGDQSNNRLYPANYIESSYFTIPENPEFMKYWERLSDSLFKIRHGLSKSGVPNTLDLFSPEIDVRQLVRVMASRGGDSLAGSLSIGSGGNSISSRIRPDYRFQVLIAEAKEITQWLISLGNDLLSTLQQKDSMKLQEKTYEYEYNLVPRLRSIKKKQIEEAENRLKQIKEQKKLVTYRIDHYDKLLKKGMNNGEIAIEALEASATVTDIVVGTQLMAANAASILPRVCVYGLAGPGVESPSISNAMLGAAGLTEFISKGARFGAMCAQRQASYARRDEEWKFQYDMGTREKESFALQEHSANIAVSLSNFELENFEETVKHQQEMYTYHLKKFTNLDLYHWYANQLSIMYRHAFDLACKVAKKAESAYNFECVLPSERKDTSQGDEQSLRYSNYPWASFWVNSRQGLLAGRQLYEVLTELEVNYRDKIGRRLEIKKVLSLREKLNKSNLGDALISDNNGLTFSISTDDLNDFDAVDKNLKRIIKSVTISVPALTHPHQQINLVLIHNASRQQIAISQGAASMGLFSPSYDGPRYLPFEGYELENSEWTLKTGSTKFTTVQTSLYKSIQDIVMIIEYTINAPCSTISQPQRTASN